MIYPIIMAGGSGTRLWPLSRKSYPKQFSKILGKETPFQERAKYFFNNKDHTFKRPIILTNQNFRFIVLEQLTNLGIRPDTIFIEPEIKNTAPAILAAALHIEKQNPNSIMLITPSDHVFSHKVLDKAIIEGLEYINKGQIVLFGIKPNKPETAYGYIKYTSDPEELSKKRSFFIEKPSLDKAKQIYSTGKYLWNSGIFLFRSTEIIRAYEKFAKSLLNNVQKSVDEGKKDLDFFRLSINQWSKCQNISIDYAILEKVNNLSVVVFDGKWTDIGAWDTVWEEQKKDKNKVAISGNVSAIDCDSSLLRSEDSELHLVGLGLKNIVGIATSDAVLIADRNRSQDVKKVVEKLKKNNIEQAEVFPKDHRPWGWFISLMKGPRFQVKKIFVFSGGALSLQSHQHRSEHWIVVEGTAKVTIDNKVNLLTEGESIYVPLGAIHRLENTGKIPLIIIEIQTGSYLGEDDIKRYEDIYSR